MGRSKAAARENNESPGRLDGTEDDTNSSGSLVDSEQTTKTRSGTYRRNLRRTRKMVRVPKVKQAKTKSTTKPAEVPLKAEPYIVDQPLEEPEVKSDIEEDECIPNGCKSIECFICGCRLSKIYNLRLHMATHQYEDSFDMDAFEYSEIFNVLNPHKRNIDSKIIRNFVMQEIKAKRYSQFYCILNEAAVELHISDSETESDDDSELIPQHNYRCELCKKNFDRRYKALFHQKTAHVKEEFVVECDYCLKKFVSMNLLIYHLKTQCENDEKPVPCTERFMKFLLRANLDHYANLAQAREQKKLHKSTEVVKRHTCDVCNKSFTRQEHLNRHSAVHLPEEMKFECPVCDRRFNRKDNMRSHMKIHTEEGARSAESRKILCSYCGRSFSSKSNYIVHMRRHTGEKPYKCSDCGKGFPKSTDLNSHKITHTGERNFVCTICSKAFARSAVLLKHMRVHNGPYPCTFCEKNFPKPSALTLHLRMHTKSQVTVICGECKTSFSTRDELEQHFTESGHSYRSKRVLVIREKLAGEDKPKSDLTATQPAPPDSTDEPQQIRIKTNDDPLEIKEEEWRTTKVKVPVNEAIQSVLQKSISTPPVEPVKPTVEETEPKVENPTGLCSSATLSERFDDEMQYNEW